MVVPRKKPGREAVNQWNLFEMCTEGYCKSASVASALRHPTDGDAANREYMALIGPGLAMLDAWKDRLITTGVKHSLEDERQRLLTVLRLVVAHLEATGAITEAKAEDGK